MKKSLKILVILLALVLSFTMLAGCNGGSGENEGTKVEKSFPESTPKAIRTVRNEAMENIQKFSKNNEGSFADRLTSLIACNYGDETLNNSEYQSLKSILDSYVTQFGADNMYVIVKNEEGKYQKTVTTKKKTTWLEEVTLSDYITENIDAGLITSSKCGHDNLWTVYSPLFDSTGIQKAVVVMEVPIDLSEYPEWDKNSDKWHGFE